MALNIKGELKRTYGIAALEREAKQHLKASEWKEYQGIRERYDGLRNVEERSFQLEYETRLRVEQRRVINQRGAKQLDHKHRWFGSDQFDKSATLKQADTNIRSKHHELIVHLTDKETGEIEALLEGAGHRQKASKKFSRDFQKTTERRDDHERRQSIKRRRD